MYFDIDVHRDCFKTKENEAYFWHGRTNGCGGQNNAIEIATEKDGRTLEMCMLDHSVISKDAKLWRSARSENSCLRVV